MGVRLRFRHQSTSRAQGKRSALAKDPVSCALMSGLFLRRLPLAIMGVRLRFRHQIYIACSRHKSFNGIA
jgi:hypothetical protein